MKKTIKNHPTSQAFPAIGFEILEQVPGSFWAIDDKYQILIGNRKFKSDMEKAFGITPERGYHILSNIPREQAQEWKTLYDKAFSGEKFQLERERRHGESGDWYEYNFSPVRNEKGKIQAVAVLALNITKRKEAESTLENLLGNLPGIAFRCLNNREWDMLFLSEGVYDLTGYTPEELLQGGGTSFNELIHPDDQRQVWKDVQAAFKEKRPYRIQYRINTKDGKIRWLSENGKATKFSSDGIPLELEGFISDITPERQIQDEIQSQQAFYNQIISTVQDGIWVTNASDRMIYVNPAMERIAGVESAEILGLSVLEDFPTETIGHFLPFYIQAKEDLSLQPYRAEVTTLNGVQTVQEGWLIPRFAGNEYRGMICTIQDVTEQHYAEQELKTSEEKYRRLFENILDGFALHEIVLDKSGNPVDYIFLEINPAFEQMTGLNRNEILGKPVTTILPGIEDDEAEWISRYGKVALTGNELRFEQYSKPLDRWYSVLAYSPRANHFATIFQDITDRKHATEELIKSELRYRTLFDTSIEALIIHKEGIILEVNQTFLDTYKTEKEQVLGQSILDFTADVDMGKARDKLKNTSDDYQEITAKRLDGTTLPIRIRGKDIQYQGDSARLVSIQDITQQKEMEKSIQESEARYRGLVESSPDGIITMEPTGKVLSVNQSFLELTGFPEEAFINIHFSKIPTLTKQDRGFYRNAFEAVLRGSYQDPIEFRWKNIKGEIREGEARISPVKIANKTILQSIVRDITKRKQQMKIIEKSDIIINTTSEAVVITDTEGRITFWNNGAKEMFGYTARETIGQSIQLLYEKEDFSLMTGLLSNLLKEVDIPDQEMILKDKSGKRIHGLISFISLKDEHGEINELVGVARDITLLKETEKSLRLEQQRALQYLNVAEIMLLAMDTNQTVTAINPKGCQVLGYTEEEVLGKNWFDNFLVSDEIDQVKIVFDNVLEGKADISEYFENKIRRSDGTSRLIAWRNSLLKDEAGNIIGVFSSGEDITDRRAAEEALVSSKETVERYLNIAAEVIISLDQDGNITMLNSSGHQLLGYQPGELIGKNWYSTCLVKDQASEVQAALEAFMAGEDLDSSPRENAVITKTGQIRYISWHNSLLTDDNGQTIGILSSGEDITEKKQILEDLARNRELIFRLSEAAQQVQNILDENVIFETIGDEVAQLGFNISILMVSEKGEELNQKFLSYDNKFIQKSLELTGILPSQFTMKIEPGNYFYQILEDKKTFIEDINAEVLKQALPGVSKGIMTKVIKTFGLNRAIYAPLIDEGNPFGIMAVIGAHLTEEDVAPMALFASQISTALRNARYARDLEQRTAELEELAALITKTEEAERKRMARELHDQVGQSLALLGFNLNQIQAQKSQLPENLIAKVSRAEIILDEVSNNIRSVMDDLRPVILDDYGLASALHWYADKISEQSELVTEVRAEIVDPRLSKEKEVTLFRITQEALTNITRHARSSKIYIKLIPSDQNVTLIIQDDGIGFDLEGVTSGQKNEGWGLKNMQERISYVGGSLEIISEKGGGTKLIIQVPRD